MLDKAYGGEDQVEYCIPLISSRFSYFHPMEDLHDIVVILGRLYEDSREAKLETG